MKSILKNIFSVALLAGLFLSCSQKQPENKVVKQENENQEKETTKAEKQPVSIFPLVVAGSIGIIHEVYFHKED